MKRFVLSYLNKIGLFCNRYLRVCYEYDFSKFRKFSGLENESPEVTAAKIRIITHTIEKAMSLSDCRDDFGKEKICNLINLCNEYEKTSRSDEDAVHLCRAIIEKYYTFRKSKGLDASFIPVTFHSTNLNVAAGATQFAIPQESRGFIKIAQSRHSIRNFDNRKVEEIDIFNAIKIAQTAPSACNRQATRIYACLSDEKIKAIKDSHGGIRTFGKPGVIFAITQDLNLYMNEYERNTWLVDGGIFCMNMLYALQSVGLGCCPVIWGGMPDEEEHMASLLGIPENERIVVLIVAGYPPADGCKTPCSSKRPVEDILHIIKS